MSCANVGWYSWHFCLLRLWFCLAELHNTHLVHSQQDSFSAGRGHLVTYGPFHQICLNHTTLGPLSCVPSGLPYSRTALICYSVVLLSIHIWKWRGRISPGGINTILLFSTDGQRDSAAESQIDVISRDHCNPLLASIYRAGWGWTQAHPHALSAVSSGFQGPRINVPRMNHILPDPAPRGDSSRREINHKDCIW